MLPPIFQVSETLQIKSPPACGVFSASAHCLEGVTKPVGLISTKLLLLLCRFTSSIWMAVMRR